jgi:hypothetical protein
VTKHSSRENKNGSPHLENIVMASGFVQDIFLNTNNRSSGTNYNAAWDIDPRLIKSGDGGFDVALIEFNVKNQVYPTNSYNNLIYFEEKTSGTVKTAAIPAGSYTIASYLVALKAALENVSENTLTYTCIYDTLTWRITISTTQVFRLRYVVNSSTQLFHAYNQLGVDLATQVDSTSATSLQLAYPYNLNGATTLNIACNLVLQNVCSDKQSNILASVPVGANFGETVNYQAQATDPVASGQGALDRIELGVFDEFGYSWPLPANVAASYRLRITCRPTSDLPSRFTFQYT